MTSNEGPKIPTTEAEISSARLRERMARIGDAIEPAGFVSLKGDTKVEFINEVDDNPKGGEE